MKLRTLLLLALVAGLFFVAGRALAPRGGGEAVHAEHEEQLPTTWTCSMHPQIQLPGPGDCPICGMDLIPVQSGSGADLGPATLELSDAAARRAAVATAPVRRQPATVEVRLAGKVGVDETRRRSITARVGGRLERLYVDVPGVRIRRGDHLVELYSPELVTAQQELLQALAAQGRGAGLMADMNKGTVEAAREKLRLLGLTAGQVQRIEERGQAQDDVTIYSPIDGVVLEKRAVEGEYVDTGQVIYELADLSRLWVRMDAYESDLQWVRYGQEVRFSAAALPGQPFTGTISLVDPVLDPVTRTAKVRVNVANPDGRLKPGMFVDAVVQATVASGGDVVHPELQGKYVCPMHPEEVSVRAGRCDVCGMALVTVEALGYGIADPDEQLPLVVPDSAPLMTGTRAVVYVELAQRDGMRVYEGRDVRLGPRVADGYIVLEGLTEGERVVVQGAFRLDAELQIRGKQSMMSPAEPPADDAPSFGGLPAGDPLGVALGQALPPYLATQEALAADDPHAAATAFGALAAALDAAHAHAEGDRMPPVMAARGAARAAAATHELPAQREAFNTITRELLPQWRSVPAGALGVDALYLMHCPMAFDNAGANWLQGSDELANPYFGASMLRCGSVEAKLAGGQ